LRAAGAFLVVDEGLEPADAVVVLSGDGGRERLDTAIALVRQGLVEWIIVLTVTPPAFYDEATALRRYARRFGIDPGRMIVAGEVHSTLDDARVAARVMRERGWERAIVVTTPYHTRRARWVFHRAWRPLGLSAVLHPASNRTFDSRRWWEDERSTEAVALEYIKLVLYAARFTVH
jgi:uncharacterized SAM-binding protein YcdF (DUF218 family)